MKLLVSIHTHMQDIYTHARARAHTPHTHTHTRTHARTHDARTRARVCVYVCVCVCVSYTEKKNIINKYEYVPHRKLLPQIETRKLHDNIHNSITACSVTRYIVFSHIKFVSPVNCNLTLITLFRTFIAYVEDKFSRCAVPKGMKVLNQTR